MSQNSQMALPVMVSDEAQAEEVHPGRHIPLPPSALAPAVVLACETEEGPFSHSKMFMPSDETEIGQPVAVAPSFLSFQGFDTSGSLTN